MKNYFSNLSREYSVYLLPTVVVLVLILVTMYVAIPKLQEIFELNANIETQQEQLIQLKKKRVLLQSISRNEVIERIKTTSSAIPSEKDAGTVIATIEGVSTLHQIGLDSLSLSPGSVSSDSAKTPLPTVHGSLGTPAFPVNIHVRGDKVQFGQFLKSIQEARRLFDISEATVTYFPDAQNFVSADLVLYAYYVPPITTISAIETPIIEITQEEQTLLAKVAQFPEIGIQFTVGQTPPEAVGKTNLFSQ